MNDETQQPLFGDAGDVSTIVTSEPAENELQAMLTSNAAEAAEHTDILLTRLDAWLKTNADPLTTDDLAAVFQQLKLSASDIPPDPNTADDSQIRVLFRSLWESQRVIVGPNNNFYRARADLPRWIMGLLGLVDEPHALKPTPRPPMLQAFMHDGQVGLGRILSSQVSLAIFTACVAFKDEWAQTAKGFPKFTLALSSGEIVLTLTPDVVSQKDSEAQVAAMNAIRDGLSIDDWELFSILMEQVLTSNNADASAYITDARALDYRKIAKNKNKGYSAGHSPVMRASVAESMNRLAHLHVRTTSLQILEAGPDGRPRKVPVDWRERVVRITGDLTRRDNDATLGWHYSFPTWFPTFLEPPNRYVGYLQQETVALHGSKQVAKRLAHYFALHLRINGQNSQRLERKMSELFGGARIPINWQRQQRTIDQLETALRDLVKNGLIRIEQDNEIIDAASPNLDAWTAVPAGLHGQNKLKGYLTQKIIIRADARIEERYDAELRRGKGRKAEAFPS